MSTEALQYCTRVFQSFKLPAASRFLLYVLASKHTHHRELRIPISTLARFVGMDKRNAHRALEALKEAGVIVVIYEKRRGRRTAQAYRFPADWDVPGAPEQWIVSCQGDNTESCQGDNALNTIKARRGQK